jgi:hypothetical protein
MSWLGMKPYRCKECNKRFHLPAKVDRTLRREKAWKRSTRRRREREVSIPSEAEVDSVS